MIKYWIAVALTSLFIACQDKIDIEVPEGDEKIVIDGFFSNLPNSAITISKTSPYFAEGGTPRVTNAQAFVTSNEGDTINLVESVIFDGTYVADKAGEIGKIYTLHLILEDGKSFTSLPELMSRVPKIDSIYYQDSKDLDNPFLEEGYVVLIETVEPAGVGDFYRWMYSKNGELQTNPDDLSYASDELVDGNFISEFDLAYELEIGDEVEILQMSISERAYNFLALIDQQTNQVGGPFDSPPSPIKGNVENDNPDRADALGYFMVSGISTAKITIR